MLEQVMLGSGRDTWSRTVRNLHDPAPVPCRRLVRLRGGAYVLAVDVEIVMTVMVVAVVVQRDAVEVDKWIPNLDAGRVQATVKGHALEPGAADVDALALLDVAEVDRVDPAAGMGHNGRLHVANESPLSGAEKGMGLDVRGSGSGPQPSILILDQEFPDQ